MLASKVADMGPLGAARVRKLAGGIGRDGLDHLIIIADELGASAGGEKGAPPASSLWVGNLHCDVTETHVSSMLSWV